MSSFMERHPYWRISATAITVTAFALVVVAVASTDANASFAKDLVDAFQGKSGEYEQKLIKATKGLFYLCATLEIAYIGIKKILGGESMHDMLKDFCIMLLTAGFFLFVLNNYGDTNPSGGESLKIREHVIHGACVLVNTDPENVKSEEPFLVGEHLADAIFKNMKMESQLSKVLIMLIAGFGVMVCFALISLEIILIKCECAIGVAMAAPFLGLGALSFLRPYAINAIKYVVAAAIKLMTIEVIINIALGIIQSIEDMEPNWTSAIIAVCTGIVLWQICERIPDLASDLLTGSYSGGSTNAGRNNGVNKAGAAVAKGIGRAVRAIVTKGK